MPRGQFASPLENRQTPTAATIAPHERRRSPDPRPRRFGRRARARQAPPAHAASDAGAVVHALPQVFGARFVPLQRGVFEALMERHPEQLKREDLKIALAQHTRSTRYLQCAWLLARRATTSTVSRLSRWRPSTCTTRSWKCSNAARAAAPKTCAQRCAASWSPPSSARACRPATTMLVQGRDEAANRSVQEALHDAEAQSARRQALQRAEEIAASYQFSPRRCTAWTCARCGVYYRFSSC